MSLRRTDGSRIKSKEIIMRNFPNIINSKIPKFNHVQVKMRKSKPKYIIINLQGSNNLLGESLGTYWGKIYSSYMV